jgi:mannose-6-phosphate isomerase-like protein (cupin superfamily)
VRNVPLDDVDTVDRAVLAIGTDYPADHLLEFHRHRRAQLLYGATGFMRVDTADATWTVPTQRAVLIPSNTEHQVLMDGVSTRSLYIEPSAVPWFPTRCQVVDVSPLLRALLLAAVQLPASYDRHGRDGALVELVLHEIQSVTPLPLDLPIPSREDLRSLCQAFAAQRQHPDVQQSVPRGNGPDLPAMASARLRPARHAAAVRGHDRHPDRGHTGL